MSQEDEEVSTFVWDEEVTDFADEFDEMIEGSCADAAGM